MSDEALTFVPIVISSLTLLLLICCLLFIFVFFVSIVESSILVIFSFELTLSIVDTFFVLKSSLLFFKSNPAVTVDAPRIVAPTSTPAITLPIFFLIKFFILFHLDDSFIFLILRLILFLPDNSSQ